MRYCGYVVCLARRYDESHEDAWLSLHLGGMNFREIAAETRVSLRRIHEGVTRAKARGGMRATAASAPGLALRLVLLNSSSCKPYALQTCGDMHKGDLPAYTSMYCDKCNKTGAVNEIRIARSFALPPIDPEGGEYRATSYVPHETLKGGRA